MNDLLSRALGQNCTTSATAAAQLYQPGSSFSWTPGDPGAGALCLVYDGIARSNYLRFYNLGEQSLLFEQDLTDGGVFTVKRGRVLHFDFNGREVAFKLVNCDKATDQMKALTAALESFLSVAVAKAGNTPTGSPEVQRQHQSVQRFHFHELNSVLGRRLRDVERSCEEGNTIQAAQSSPKSPVSGRQSPAHEIASGQKYLKSMMKRKFKPLPMQERLDVREDILHQIRAFNRASLRPARQRVLKPPPMEESLDTAFARLEQLRCQRQFASPRTSRCAIVSRELIEPTVTARPEMHAPIAVELNQRMNCEAVQKMSRLRQLPGSMARSDHEPEFKSA